MTSTPQRENNAARKIQRAWHARTGKNPSAKNKFGYFSKYRYRLIVQDVGTPLRNFSFGGIYPRDNHKNYKITHRNLRMYNGEKRRREIENLAKKLNAIAQKHKKPATLTYRASPRPAYNFASHLKNASPGRAGYYMQSPKRPLTLKQLAVRTLSRTRQKRAELGLRGGNKSVRNAIAEKLVREKWVIPFLTRRFKERHG